MRMLLHQRLTGAEVRRLLRDLLNDGWNFAMAAGGGDLWVITVGVVVR